MSTANFLIAGLGNIGDEYVSTRHNMGFIMLDAFAKASNITFATGRYGDMATVSHKGRKLYLLKPSTYMNLSGNAIRYWSVKLGIPPEQVLVICDDLNLPFGTIRMRKAGSDGGHNGLKNIQEELGTQAFPRIRIGIGNDFSRGGQIDFVLGRFSEEDLKLIPQIEEKIVSGIRDFCTIGPDLTMNSINVKKLF